MTVAFERTILQSLPPPYETHCHDYRLDGYTCRDDCLTQCKTKLYLKLDGWPGDVYANKSVTQRISNVWSNNWSQTGHLEEGLDPESLSTCSDQCGRAEDCETAQYDVRTVRIREREEEDRQESHSFTVAILPPKNGNVINKHVPKLEPIEFLVRSFLIDDLNWLTGFFSCLPPPGLRGQFDQPLPWHVRGVGGRLLRTLSHLFHQDAIQYMQLWFEKRTENR